MLAWDRATFLTRAHLPVPESFAGRFASLVERRVRREPVSLILGRREFWGLDFEVTREVLTPRPETELLVEEAARVLTGLLSGHDRTASTPRVADVGTGSGCIAVALATECPTIHIVAIDASSAALAVARRNAQRHDVAGRIDWRWGRYLDGLTDRFDLIVANLPYVAEADVRTLPPEVREFEPLAALAGGRDGLDAVRYLVSHAAPRLRPGGSLMVEIGHHQLEKLHRHARSIPELTITAVRRDLQGIPRVVVMRKPSGD